MQRPKVFKGKVDERCNDACRKYPFGDVEGDDGLDLAGPAIEGKQVDSSEDIDSINGDRYDKRDYEVAVGQGSETRGGLEVIETLQGC